MLLFDRHEIQAGEEDQKNVPEPDTDDGIRGGMRRAVESGKR